MFRFSHNYPITLTERPAFTKMIDKIEAIKLNDGYIIDLDVEHLTMHIIKIEKKEETKMSMLSEKRHEIQAKLDKIMQDRKTTIESKVQLYRTQLESEALPAEALELKNVLSAIDAVIAYDESYVPQPQPTVVAQPAVAVAEPVHVDVEPQANVASDLTQPVQEVPQTIAQPVEEVVAPVSIVEAAPAVETIPAGEVISTPTDGRPGMPTINVPDRG